MDHLGCTVRSTILAVCQQRSVRSAMPQRMLARESQREGIAIAKREDVYKGRKKKLSMEAVTTIHQRISEGESKAQIARDLGVSRKTLYQYIKAT